MERKIWDFEGFTICRILGLTFDRIEMNTIFKELKVDGYQFLTESDMHSALVRACAERNFVSEYIDKRLRGRFERYKKRLEGLDQEDICLLIEGEINSKMFPSLLSFGLLHEVRRKSIQCCSSKRTSSFKVL